MPRESIYIDSCCWIALYKPGEKISPEDRTGIQTALDAVNGGSVILVASSMLLAEALTVSVERFEQAFDGRKGLMVAADDPIMRQARELQFKLYAQEGKVLTPIDSVHLATAANMGCQRFMTLDRKRKDNKLAPVEDRALLERLLGLKIITPNEFSGQARIVFPEFETLAPEEEA